MEKIYEQAKDLHVRSIVAHGDENHVLWANDDSTFPVGLEAKEIADAFKKGMLVVSDGDNLMKPISVGEDGGIITAYDNDNVLTMQKWTVGEDTVDVDPVASGTFWGTSVASMQSSLAVSGRSITGTLLYLSSGQLVTDWGAGNFMALEFDWPDGATSVKVGLEPSMGSGLVEAINDPDKNGVFKVTDKNKQVFKVVATNGVETVVQTYSLAELVCNKE